MLSRYLLKSTAVDRLTFNLRKGRRYSRPTSNFSLLSVQHQYSSPTIRQESNPSICFAIKTNLGQWLILIYSFLEWARLREEVCAYMNWMTWNKLCTRLAWMSQS